MTPDLVELLSDTLRRYSDWVQTNIDSLGAKNQSPHTVVALRQMEAKVQRSRELAELARGAIVLFPKLGLGKVSDRATTTQVATAASHWTGSDYRLAIQACSVLKDELEVLLCLGEVLNGEASDDGQDALADLREQVAAFSCLKTLLKRSVWILERQRSGACHPSTFLEVDRSLSVG